VCIFKTYLLPAMLAVIFGQSCGNRTKTPNFTVTTQPPNQKPTGLPERKPYSIEDPSKEASQALLKLWVKATKNPGYQKVKIFLFTTGAKEKVTYECLEGCPEGLEINQETGLVSWEEKTSPAEQTLLFSATSGNAAATLTLNLTIQVIISGIPSNKQLVEKSELQPSSIVSGAQIGGVLGTYVIPEPSLVKSRVNYGANGNSLTGLFAPDFPDASNVRAQDTVNGVPGTLTDCSTDGSAGCVAVTNFQAVDMSLLTPANIRSGVTIAGQMGTYPSVLNPLNGSSGTDLPSLDASVSAGSYQFFRSDGTRVTGSISDVGNITPSFSSQTFNSSLYRGFTVSGSTSLSASNILSGITIFGVPGNLSLPSNTDVKSGVNYGANGNSLSGLFAPDFPDASNVLNSDTTNGISGTLPICNADGEMSCYISATGTVKAAETQNFSGWDLRRKRDAGGAILTFGGIQGNIKSCRNNSDLTVFDNASPNPFSYAGLDIYDTRDASTASQSLATQVPPWIIPNVTGDHRNDFSCGSIISTGETTTGNTGADSTLTHNPNGNWQDLTPGIMPNGGASSVPIEGCNATDKHCVFRDLLSGMMVTELSPDTDTWYDAISYCETLGESGGAIASPIPVIGGAAYSDWRLPTQKEFMQLYNSGMITLSSTSSLRSNYGNMHGLLLWNSTSRNLTSTRAYQMDTLWAEIPNKSGQSKFFCVR
jgi:hypothetical protein